MSEDIFAEEIIWTDVIPEIQRHIATTDAEFEREWEAKVERKASSQIQLKAATAAKGFSTPQAALDEIVKLGCDRERIVRLLYMYVGGDPEKVDAVKRGFQRQRDHLLSTDRSTQYNG